MVLPENCGHLSLSLSQLGVASKSVEDLPLHGNVGL